MTYAFNGAAPPPDHEPGRPAGLRVWRWALHWQILLGLVVGALLGWWLGAWAVSSAEARLPAWEQQRAVYQGRLTEAGVDDEALKRISEAATSASATPGDIAAAVRAQAVRDQVEADARRDGTDPGPKPSATTTATDNWAFILFDLVGDLFISGLRLIIVPLVTSSIILAVAGMGAAEGFGRLGVKALAYYMTTSTLAILTGLVLVNAFQPGVGASGLGILQGEDLSAFAGDQAAVENRAGERGAADFLDVFRQMVPPNVIAAAAEGQLLGLIVVSLFVGYFLARSTGDPRAAVLNFTQGVYDITFKITDVVLRLAPIGVLALLFVTVAEQYAKLVPDDRLWEFINGIGIFAGVTVAALAFHLTFTMCAILLGIARVNPLRHYKAMAPAMVTAFSTSSSAATLPVTMDCVEKRAGVSNKTTSFVLPLGATVNMDGTALYECTAAIFICQAFGIDLSLSQQFLIVIVALVTSVGVAAVPAASLVAIIVILQAVEASLPPGALPDGVSLIAGMGLLFVFDRPLDMCRTVVNIFSDSVGAVTVARTEGETGVLAAERIE